MTQSTEMMATCFHLSTPGTSQEKRQARENAVTAILAAAELKNDDGMKYMFIEKLLGFFWSDTSVTVFWHGTLPDEGAINEVNKYLAETAGLVIYHIPMIRDKDQIETYEVKNPDGCGIDFKATKQT